MEPTDNFVPVDILPKLHRGNPDIRWRTGLNLVEKIGISAHAEVDYRAVELDRYQTPDAVCYEQPISLAA